MASNRVIPIAPTSMFWHRFARYTPCQAKQHPTIDMLKGKPDQGAPASLLQRLAIVVAGLFLLPALAGGVVRDHYFRTLDSRHGLLQSTVTAILQDRAGFVWIATMGNLHRFDGYRFQTIDELLDQQGLPDAVHALAEGADGVFYAGTAQDGLFRVDLVSRTATAVVPASSAKPGAQINVLLYQQGIGLWVGHSHGVGLYDPASNQFQPVLVFEPVAADGSSPDQVVRALALDNDGLLWVGTNQALERIDTARLTATRFADTAAGALITGHNGELWVGGPEGLYIKPANARQLSPVWPSAPLTTDADSACCNTIALAQAADGAIWMSMRGGHVWRYEPDTGEAAAIAVNPWVDGMLAERSLTHMMIDRSNLLWLGTHARGVATTPAESSPFRTVIDMDPDGDALTGNLIRSVMEDPDGGLWLGTFAGLRHYDMQQDRFENFNDIFLPRPGTGAQRGNPLVNDIQPAPDGDLWLATQWGLYRFDPRQREARPIALQGSLAPVSLRAIAPLRDGSLLLAYADKGLLRYDPANGQSTPLLPEPDATGTRYQRRITTVLQDSRDRIWVGGTAGLSLVNLQTGQITNFAPEPARAGSLSGRMIRAILETRDGTLWIGSHLGLDQVLESTNGQFQFRAWPLTGSSVDPIVYDIAEDNDGYLWISGNDGLVRLDRGDGSHIRFGLTDGLQNLEFNAGAATVLRDGRLVFGGVRGFNLIDPDKVRLNNYDPPIVITWTAQANEPPTNRLGSGDTPTITMPASRRQLSLGFAALDYAAPHNNMFSYRLEGFDPDFSAPSTRPWVSYTNLAPGSYVLHVRASNHSGVWSSNELRVPIEILPAWWQTRLAFAGYVAGSALLLFLLWLWQRRRAAPQRELQAQIQEREDRLRLSLWGAGYSFWDWDLRSNRIQRIGASQTLLGPEHGEMAVVDWRQHAVHPDDLARVQRLMQDHLAGKTEAYESEHRVRNVHGDWSWVRARGKVVERDANNNPLRVAGTARDISASRQHERERRIAAEVLRSMSEAVAVIDLNFRFVSVNPAFSRITGYREQDVLGMPDSLLESTQHTPEFNQHAHKELIAKGHYKGELWLRRADGDEFLSWVEISEVRDEADVRTHFVAVVNDITDKKRAEQELRYLANYDTLTGLPNRSLLSERLARAVVRARRHATQVAVLFLDLDHFKIVNDSLGHATGDRILKAAAARLLGVVGSSDTVARLGGDEFTIVMEDIDRTASVTAMAEAVIAAFGAPILVDAHSEVVISPSIGISLYPEHAQVPVDLLKFADAAMYRAKERGRNTFQYYDESMDSAVRLRATMTAALRRAAERKEFHLHFQPRQTLFDERIVGVEALLRWDCEEFGSVPPSTFIPILEETGLILPIGEWVLEEACRQLRQWDAHALTSVGVSVNVSVLQMLRGDLPGSVAKVLEKTGLSASRLELEITESMVMANAEQTINTLRDLKRLGVSIAIDDFGTGYSSLIYLKRLPIDTLKIDKEFVGDLTHDPDDEAIVTTIISMAHSLGLNVVAEGVETAEQLSFLRQHGCDEIQGYLLARPLTPDDCLEFLRGRTVRQPDLPTA